MNKTLKILILSIIIVMMGTFAIGAETARIVGIGHEFVNIEGLMLYMPILPCLTRLMMFLFWNWAANLKSGIMD